MINYCVSVYLRDDFRRALKGEVLDDDFSKTYYSVDSSNYQIYPQLICFPKDKDDIIESLEYAKNNDISITCRGAGTGLIGNSLSNGLILDFSKYMNEIIDIDVKHNVVYTQPGIVKSILDKELKKLGKFIPPDPASSNYCTVGGMISNNSSGIHSLGFGSIFHYLHKVNFIYSNGIEGFATDSCCDKKMRDILIPISTNYEKIISFYPSVKKNSCGYRIDAVFNKIFRPQNIFAASEGTLGIIHSIGLKMLDLPDYRSLFLIRFPNILTSTNYVNSLLSTFPIAMELLDSSVMDSFIESIVTNKKDCLIFIEYSYNKEHNINFIYNSLRDAIYPDGEIIEEAHDELSITKLWHSRKNALNIAIKNTVGTRKPFAIIEDTVVNPNYMNEYVKFLLCIYQKLNLSYVIYGHVGDGNLHTRPIICDDTDYMSSHKLDTLLKNLANTVFKKVIELKGTITGEHGDGIARTPYIRMMYGDYVYSYFKYLKTSFDPTNRLNPGKKVIY